MLSVHTTFRNEKEKASLKGNDSLKKKKKEREAKRKGDKIGPF